MAPLAAAKLPYRDINVRVTSEAYTFTSPSSPDAPALLIDRPTGDVRLADASLHAGKRATRVSSVAGILGLVQLRLGQCQQAVAAPWPGTYARLTAPQTSTSSSSARPSP